LNTIRERRRTGPVRAGTRPEAQPSSSCMAGRDRLRSVAPNQDASSDAERGCHQLETRAEIRRCRLRATGRSRSVSKPCEWLRRGRRQRPSGGRHGRSDTRQPRPSGRGGGCSITQAWSRSSAAGVLRGGGCKGRGRPSARRESGTRSGRVLRGEIGRRARQHRERVPLEGHAPGRTRWAGAFVQVEWEAAQHLRERAAEHGGTGRTGRRSRLEGTCNLARHAGSVEGSRRPRRLRLAGRTGTPGRSARARERWTRRDTRAPLERLRPGEQPCGLGRRAGRRDSRLFVSRERKRTGSGRLECGSARRTRRKRAHGLRHVGERRARSAAEVRDLGHVPEAVDERRRSGVLVGERVGLLRQDGTEPARGTRNGGTPHRPGSVGTPLALVSGGRGSGSQESRDHRSPR